MKELGPDARALLDAALAEERPTAADRARVRRGLARALAPVAAATATTAASKGAIAAAAAKLGLPAAALKAIASVILVGAVGTGIAAGLGAARVEAPGAAGRLSSRAMQAPARDNAGAEAQEEAKAVPEVAAAPEVDPREPTAPAIPGRSAQSPAPARPNRAGLSPSAAPEDPLIAETRHLGEAYRALQSDDPARALALLDEQSAVHAGGELGEERAAARVTALCKLGRREEAAAAAARFLRDHPRSPHADRVRAACAAPEER